MLFSTSTVNILPRGTDAELPAVSEIDVLINIKYKQLMEMLSSVRASAVQRKILKLASIIQLPLFNYFRAALHAYTSKHTLSDTHSFTYSAVHAGA